MKVKIGRLKKDILRIAEIGAQNEGVTRLAFTEQDLQARILLKDMMRDADLAVTVDAAGNIIGSGASSENLTNPYRNGAQSIIVGSHIDTVPNAGVFDGVLGICAGIECWRVLKENGHRTTHPIEVVSFSDEEGTLTKGLFGSRAVFGEVDRKELCSSTKDPGRCWEAIADSGVRLDRLHTAMRNPDTIKAYLELHIEQGPVLDSKRIPIGIVTDIAGICRYALETFGEANHAGTTPMEFRNDALVKASRIISCIPDLIERKRTKDDYFVGTVGIVEVKPGAPNVIPGRVRCILELRALKKDYFSSFVRDLQELMRDLTILGEIEELSRQEPVMLHRHVQEVIENASKQSRFESHRMVSGAGHDAMVFAPHVPTGMIFVPSINGRSHCPEERTMWRACERGAQVLLETLIQVDSIVEE